MKMIPNNRGENYLNSEFIGGRGAWWEGVSQYAGTQMTVALSPVIVI
jgi:hypothetical protein